MYHVYFLRSLKNNKVYVGYSSKDPNVRLSEHNQSSNQWSKQNTPLELLYYEKYSCSEDARKREVFYKTGFGRQIRDAIIKTVSSKSGSSFG